MAQQIKENKIYVFDAKTKNTEVFEHGKQYTPKKGLVCVLFVLQIMIVILGVDQKLRCTKIKQKMKMTVNKKIPVQCTIYKNSLFSCGKTKFLTRLLKV